MKTTLHARSSLSVHPSRSPSALVLGVCDPDVDLEEVEASYYVRWHQGRVAYFYYRFGTWCLQLVENPLFQVSTPRQYLSASSSG